MSQKEKIVFSLETVTKGTKDVLSTVSATERLTKAIAEQETSVKSLSQQLSSVKGFESAKSRAAKLGQQLDDAKRQFESLGIEMESQKKHTASLRTEHRKAEREVKSLSQQMQSASRDGVAGLKAKLGEAQAKMSSLNDEVIESKQRHNELGIAYRRTGKSVKELSEKQIELRKKTVSLGSALRQSGVSTHKLGDEQERLKRQAEQASAALARQNARLKEMNSIQNRIDGRKAKLGELGSQATGLAMAAAPIAGTAYMAMKNESSFADVKKVVDMSPEQAVELKSWSLKQSTQTPMTSDEINAMLAAGGQSGIQNIDELKAYVLDAAKMAVAFDVDAKTAGETLATFKASMGLDQKGAMNLAGMANLMSNNSNSKAADIADVMARQGATAMSSGFKLNEVTALSSSLLATGLGPERAATAVKNISGSLSKGSSASKDQKAALASLGFGADDLASNMQRDASGTLMKVLNAIKKAPLEKQSALISRIFGEEVKGSVAALANNTDLYVTALKLAERGQKANEESLNQEYQAKLNTSKNNVQLFTNSLTRLSIVFGDALLPTLNSALKVLGPMVDSIADFIEKNQDFAAVIGVGATAIIGLKAAMIAGKTASLFFGNTRDKGRLFRKGLNRETKESGDIAAYTAKRWSRLNAVMSQNSGGSTQGGGNNTGRRGKKGKGSSRSSSNTGNNKQKGKTSQRSGGRFSRGRGRGLGSLLMLGGGLALESIPSLVAADRREGDDAKVNEKQGDKSISSRDDGRSEQALGVSNVLNEVLAPPPSSTADMVDIGLGIGGDLAMSMGKNGLGKVLRPVGMAMNVVNIGQSLKEGDMTGVGENVGGLAGSLAGAATGAAIGSVVPIVGTAIGGFIGSIIGAFGGEAIGGWFGNKLDSPDVMAEKIAKAQVEKEKQVKPVQFSPTITVNALPGQDAKEVARETIEQMNTRYAYLMGGNTMTTQLSYAGIDRD